MFASYGTAPTRSSSRNRCSPSHGKAALWCQNDELVNSRCAKSARQTWPRAKSSSVRTLDWGYRGSSAYGEVASLLAHEADADNFLVKLAAKVAEAPLTLHAEQPHVGLEPGASLGTYRIERPLGRGGMGVVPLGPRHHPPSESRPLRARVAQGSRSSLSRFARRLNP